MAKLRDQSKRKPHHLPKITDSFVEDVRRPPVGANPKFYWDKSRTGFGVKIYPPAKDPNKNSGRVYVLRVTKEGNSKRLFTIGHHKDPWKADDAREEARLMKLNLKQGKPHDAHHGDQKAVLFQLKDLAKEFFDDFDDQVTQGIKQAETIRKYRKQWDRNVSTKLKNTPVGSLKMSLFKLELKRISKLKSNHPRPVEGNRTIDMLSAMLGWVMEQDQEDRMGLKENHCLAVPRNAEPETIGIWMEDDQQCRLLSFLLDPANRREVWYATERQARLDAIGKHPRRIALKQPPYLITNQMAWALLLLFLSGLRSWEVKALKWSDIHARSRKLVIKQTKRGPHPTSEQDSKYIYLSTEVQEILDQIPKINDWVFPSSGRSKKPTSGHIENLQDSWERVRQHLNLPHIRLHDYRHTAASEAGDDKEVSAKDLREGFGWKTDTTALKYLHSKHQTRDERFQTVVTNRMERLKNIQIEEVAVSAPISGQNENKKSASAKQRKLKGLRPERLQKSGVRGKAVRKPHSGDQSGEV